MYLSASKKDIIVYQIGVSTVSVKVVETFAIFCNSYVCDRCYGLYMLSVVFFKSGTWICNKVLINSLC